ncbi:FadD3 family acyl-CoA ligase [Actinomadura livida]|uniref:Acyl-CoA synthetase (AMP-forming)/AMP-acid ligase II n=1 Tax=Actinomadura livida TaxID=79909 RepID=A0A7W7IFF8_9ACTN|nr:MULTISPECIES: FadD3 family acyl-CoA ligase [Actinomadura]MBB4776010.1 acyl-CoA synthetase (AMP-forming)/AMP-acid ligase II [Actinomadura catellatispora]GGU16125.1 acyl-CoA synthetase [Actinomadura livida]
MNNSDGPVWPSIAAMTESAAERFADRTAIVDGGERVTYERLYAEARGFGAALVAAGVEPGDRVAIWAFNCREWIVALLGLYQAGATLVPVNTRFKGREAADILRRARVRVLVTVTEFLGNDYVAMLRDTGEPLPDLHTVVIARGGPSGSAVPWGDFLARATGDDLAEVDRRRAALGPDDPSDVLFTSGTTGTPKGVLMTHRRTMGVGADWVSMTGLSAGDRYVMVNPFFHMFGFKGGILACVAAGATMLPQPTLDVDRVLGQVAAERVTVLPGPPALYHAILEHPGRGRYDLSSLRVAVTGAADIPVELIRRVRDELPFSAIITGYGLTEAGTASSTSPDDDPETTATTVGRPRPGFEIRVVDASGAAAAQGEVGEIVLRGPTTMVGYLDDPGATSAVLSEDGWLRTGDLGSLDERGCLRIAGRSKDMFIVGGFNAYPAEIEAMLLEHPGVLQAAVIGVPDERLGQVGMAFIVPREPGLAEADVLAWCRDRMANYKVPRSVRLIDELPLTESGKVRKNALEARAAAERSG